jgi:hypothetical protein
MKTKLLSALLVILLCSAATVAVNSVFGSTYTVDYSNGYSGGSEQTNTYYKLNSDEDPLNVTWNAYVKNEVFDSTVSSPITGNPYHVPSTPANYYSPANQELTTGQDITIYQEIDSATKSGAEYLGGTEVGGTFTATISNQNILPE